MQTYDIKRERKDLYAPKPGNVEFVDVPEMAFLMVDGHGDPNTSSAYREAVEALYTTSYAVRAEAGRQALQARWGEDNYRGYVRRPDIHVRVRQLEQLLASKAIVQRTEGD